jgi:NADH dehydrogenase FAD-containing subunit
MVVGFTTTVQSVPITTSFILSRNKSQFYRFDTSGDLTYDLLVYATGGEQANHYTTEAVKEKF